MFINRLYIYLLSIYKIKKILLNNLLNHKNRKKVVSLIKKANFFCSSLDLHYLCSNEGTRFYLDMITPTKK